MYLRTTTAVYRWTQRNMCCLSPLGVWPFSKDQLRVSLLVVSLNKTQIESRCGLLPRTDSQTCFVRVPRCRRRANRSIVISKQGVRIECTVINVSSDELIYWKQGRHRPRCHHARERADVTKLRIGVFSEKTILRHEFRFTYLVEFQYQ